MYVSQDPNEMALMQEECLAGIRIPLTMAKHEESTMPFGMFQFHLKKLRERERERVRLMDESRKP